MNVGTEINYFKTKQNKIFQAKSWRLSAKEQRVMESLNLNLKGILTGIKASAEKGGNR